MISSDAPLRAPRVQRVPQAISVVMSVLDRARSQLAISWNQHCAAPWRSISCSSTQGPVAPVGIGLATAVATWVPSSQASTPVPGVLRRIRQWVWRRVVALLSTTAAPVGNSVSVAPVEETVASEIPLERMRGMSFALT
jgi:hypothetical protein